MNNENFHPILKEPPLAHALHQWDETTRTLTYEYNGRHIITLVVPGDEEVGFRHGSDGNLQNNPFVQQLYFMTDTSVHCQCRIQLSHDAVCMKPKRASHEEAIIGQVGRPLIKGVNGLYDIHQDLLIEWLGQPWSWEETILQYNEKNELYALIDVVIGPKPWFINLRMQYYRQHLGYQYHEPWKYRPSPESVTGWCSWEAYRRDVNQENIQEASEFFSEHLKDFGFETIQLDDGFEKMPLPYKDNAPLWEGWVHTNDQFPNGHEKVVETIQNAGLKAGVWTNSNVTNKAFAEYYNEHFLKDGEGNLLLGEWIDYLINCTPESLETHVIPFYRKLKELGYDYFKTDAIRHLLFDGLYEAVRQGLISNVEARDKFRAYMEGARAGIGEDAYLLASWGVMAEVVGLVDACRIAMDANPTWAGVRMQLFESARWFHTQRILFLNDPDHICGRAKLEWVRTVTSMVSLTGSLLMLSDPLFDYDEPRLAIFKKNLPTLQTMAGETGPLDTDYAAFTWTKLHGFAVPREKPVVAEDVTMEDAWNMSGDSPTIGNVHPFSTLWAIHLDHAGRRWTVALRVATVPLQAAQLNLSQVNLDEATRYHCVDFWKKEYLGLVQGSIETRALPLGECQVLGFIPLQERPHLISSFRHVSMGAVSVLGETFENNRLTIQLKGVVCETEDFWIHLPDDYEMDQITIRGGSIQRDIEQGVLRLSILFLQEELNLSIQFN